MRRPQSPFVEVGDKVVSEATVEKVVGHKKRLSGRHSPVRMFPVSFYDTGSLPFRLFVGFWG